VEGYLDALEPGLVARGFRSLRAPQPARRSGILAVEPPPGTSTARISAGLAERGVACATPDGALRFSPHWPNAVEEVPEVLEAVDGALRAARAGGSAG
jgi:selenocysteine lyase/cysteine desulfurase